MAKKRGKLGLEFIETGGDSIAKTARTVPKKRSKRSKKTSGAGSSSSSMSSKSSSDASVISPLLQEWATGQTEDDDEEFDEENTTISTASAATFEKFEKDTSSSKSNKKTSKSGTKSAKQFQDADRKALVLDLVQQVQDVLEESKEKNKKTSDMDDILSPIRQLMALPNANTDLRQLIAGSTRYNYRLTWVGSDTAICHMGTGLHNVPLARLQEVFLSCAGKSRMELLEVIRIIGPFPNVRNTLEGACKIGKRGLVYGDSSGGAETTVTQLSINYDSMIDGTGKVITAGEDDNVRKLDVHIAFCDENVIVAIVPPEGGGVRDDPLENNGANVLFFAAEDDLDEKLDALRVL